MRSYERARRALERALATHRPDGRAPPTSYTYATRGVVYSRLQSPSPEPPFRSQALEETVWIDLRPTGSPIARAWNIRSSPFENVSMSTGREGYA